MKKRKYKHFLKYAFAVFSSLVVALSSTATISANNKPISNNKKYNKTLMNEKTQDETSINVNEEENSLDFFNEVFNIQSINNIIDMKIVNNVDAFFVAEDKNYDFLHLRNNSKTTTINLNEKNNHFEFSNFNSITKTVTIDLEEKNNSYEVLKKVNDLSLNKKYKINNFIGKIKNELTENPYKISNLVDLFQENEKLFGYSTKSPEIEQVKIDLKENVKRIELNSVKNNKIITQSSYSDLSSYGKNNTHNTNRYSENIKYMNNVKNRVYNHWVTFTGLAVGAAIAAAGYWAAAWWFGLSIPWAIGATAIAVALGAMALIANQAVYAISEIIYGLSKFIIGDKTFKVFIDTALFSLVIFIPAALVSLLINKALIKFKYWTFPPAIKAVIDAFLLWSDLDSLKSYTQIILDYSKWRNNN